MQPDQFTNPHQRKLSPAIISLIVIVVIGAIAGTAYLATRGDNDQTDTASTQQTTQENTATDTATESTDTSDTADSSSTYANGTYTATGSYSTPGGTESIEVTATLADGKVTTVSATGSASGGNSAQYQSMFLSSYEGLVEGKSIDSISLSRVSGSSLTSNGFNAAIEEIKREALS